MNVDHPVNIPGDILLFWSPPSKTGTSLTMFLGH